MSVGAREAKEPPGGAGALSRAGGRLPLRSRISTPEDCPNFRTFQSSLAPQTDGLGLAADTATRAVEGGIFACCAASISSVSTKLFDTLHFVT